MYEYIENLSTERLRVATVDNADGSDAVPNIEWVENYVSGVNITEASSPTVITNTAESISKTTGSLVTAGGIGIAKNLTVGGGKVSIVGVGGGGSTSILDLATYNDSVSNRIITTDMADFSGKFDFQTKQPGAMANPLVTRLSISSSGIVSVSNTTDSNSTTSGSVQFAGGLGVVKNIFCGSNITCASPTVSGHATTKGYVDTITNGLQSSITANTSSISTLQSSVTSNTSSISTLQSSVTSNSSSITTLQSSVTSNTSSINTNTSSISANTSSINNLNTLVAGKQDTITVSLPLVKTGVNLSLDTSQITSVGTVTSFTSSGVLNVTNTTDTTSAISGSLKTSGGVGIGKNLYVAGGKLQVVGLGGANSTSIIDLSTYTDTIPTNRIVTTDEGNFSSSFAFQSKTPGAGTNPLVTRLSITAAGIVAVSNTTESSSTSTGCLTLSGGLGVSKKITSSNFETGDWTPTFTQTGVTWSTPSVWAHYVRFGNLMRIRILFSASNLGSVGTGALTFNLPSGVIPTESTNFRYTDTEVQTPGVYTHLVPSIIGSNTCTLLTDALTNHALLTGGTTIRVEVCFRV